jgi:molybdate transport system substrate-binding protein
MPETSPRLRLFAAGSLRAALTALVTELMVPGELPELVFGPAGLLRERIESADVPDLFLSANLQHPAALSANRPGTVVQPFARNALVAVARRELGLTSGNFLDRLLLDRVRIGTSTPLLDPSGDYAQQLFAQADVQRPGSGASLASRARHLVGRRESPSVPEGRYPAREFLEAGEVDVFLTYLSNAMTMADAFDVVIPPDALTVRAEYGLIILAREASHRTEAAALVTDILSPRGQAVLLRHGFQPPDNLQFP